MICFDCRRKRPLLSNGRCSQCTEARIEADRRLMAERDTCVRRPGGFGCPCDMCAAIREGYANNYGAEEPVEAWR